MFKIFQFIRVVENCVSNKMTGLRVPQEHIKRLLEEIREFVIGFETPADLSPLSAEQLVYCKIWAMKCMRNGFSRTPPFFMCPSSENSLVTYSSVSSKSDSYNENSAENLNNTSTEDWTDNSNNSLTDLEDESSMSNGSSQDSNLQLNRTVEALQGFRNTLTKTVPVGEFKRKLKELEDLLLSAINTWKVRKYYGHVSVANYKKEILLTLLSCDYNICFSLENVSQPESFEDLISRVFPDIAEEGRNDFVKYFARAVTQNPFFKELMNSLVGVHDCYCRGGECIATYC